jgi:hypothetical protein
MRARLALVVLSAVFAVGAGTAVYLATDESKRDPPVHKAKQSPLLEEAKADGVISGYRIVPGMYGTYGYETSGPEVRLTFPNACGYRSCPQSTPVIQIEYQHAAASEARRILKLTRAWAKRTFHHEGLGFKLKFFEVTG